jgi:hypothetical protein
MHVIPATWERGGEVGRSTSEASPRQKLKTLSEKQTKSKMTKGCGSSGRVLV